MFLLKLDFASGHCVSVITLLVRISLKGVLRKDSQALEPNSFMGLHPI